MPAANVEVRAHNVVDDVLPEKAFDLVHEWLVLIHIPERVAALERLVSALRPGDWLLAEDFDAEIDPYLAVLDDGTVDPSHRSSCPPGAGVPSIRGALETRVCSRSRRTSLSRRRDQLAVSCVPQATRTRRPPSSGCAGLPSRCGRSIRSWPPTRRRCRSCSPASADARTAENDVLEGADADVLRAPLARRRDAIGAESRSAPAESSTSRVDRVDAQMRDIENRAAGRRGVRASGADLGRGELAGLEAGDGADADLFADLGSSIPTPTTRAASHARRWAPPDGIASSPRGRTALAPARERPREVGASPPRGRRGSCTNA